VTTTRRQGLRGNPSKIIEGYKAGVQAKDVVLGILSGMSHFNFGPRNFALTQGGRIHSLEDL